MSSELHRACDYSWDLYIFCSSPVAILCAQFLNAHLFPFRTHKGLWIGDFLAHALDTAESVKVDCFPSGHTAGAVLVILATRKWMPRLFWVVLPIASSLIFATVYLRYHYVIDLIAGAALAVAAFWVSGLVTDWLVRTRTDTVSTDPQEA